MEQEKQQQENKKKHLGKMMKIAKWLMLIMSLVGLANYVTEIFMSGFIAFEIIVAILGIIGAILLFQKKKAGIIIGIIWSAVQLVAVQINNWVISFYQFLHIDFTLDLSSGDSVMIYNFNFLALALLIVFIQNRKKLYF